jgi:hypothetical protein
VACDEWMVGNWMSAPPQIYFCRRRVSIMFSLLASNPISLVQKDKQSS